MPPVWARVLGTGFGGLAPSLLLQTEHGCILFNAAEGMQRFCAANKVKFGKLHSVFLTDLAPGAFGGLPGLLLSASDMGIKKLNICGPDRVLDLLRSSHTFVRRETLALQVLLADSGDCDGFVVPGKLRLQVTPIRVLQQTTGGEGPADATSATRPAKVDKSSDGKGDDDDDDDEDEEEEVEEDEEEDEEEETKRKKKKQKQKMTEEESIPRREPTEVVDQRQSKKRKIEKSGLPIWPQSQLCMKLRSMAHSRIYRPPVPPTDVRVAKNVMLLQKQLDGMKSTYTVAESLDAFQLSSPAALRLQKVEKINVEGEAAAKFGAARDLEQSINSVRAAERDASTARDIAVTDRGEPEIFFLGTGSAQPSKHRNASSIYIDLNPLEGEGSILLDTGEGTLGQLIKMYGTTEAHVRVRALLGIWISHIHADHHIGLLSLLHCRHQLGAEQKLIVVGPMQLGWWLRCYTSAHPELASTFQFIDCEETAGKFGYESSSPALPKSEGVADAVKPMDSECSGSTSAASDGIEIGTEKHANEDHEKLHSKRTPNHDLLQDFMARCGLSDFQSVKVRHCHRSYGLVMKSNCGWKLVYSGDTVPSQTLIEAGRGADVLIHEATFDDTMVQEAKKRKHSTLSGAVRVFREMNASSLLLTHFSQRYPRLSQENAGLPKRCALAFDLMSVRRADFAWIHTLNDVLKSLYDDELADRTGQASPTAGSSPMVT
eukprot:g3760.t1